MEGRRGGGALIPRGDHDLAMDQFQAQGPSRLGSQRSGSRLPADHNLSRSSGSTCGTLAIALRNFRRLPRPARSAR